MHLVKHALCAIWAVVTVPKVSETCTHCGKKTKGKYILRSEKMTRFVSAKKAVNEFYEKKSIEML